MMAMCDKCMKLSGVLLVVVGVLFLLVDLGVWAFWNIKWWTMIFLLMGLGTLGCAGCKELRKGK